jgi:hypothetical protein
MESEGLVAIERRGFSSGVVTLNEFFFAVFLKIFEVGSNASFGEE